MDKENNMSTFFDLIEEVTCFSEQGKMEGSNMLHDRCDKKIR